MAVFAYILKNVERLDIDVSTMHLELLGVKITQPNQKDLLVLLLYRPPAGNLDDFCEQLKLTVLSLPCRDEVVILGDLNVNYSNKTCSATKKLLRWEKDLLLTQVISGNTRTSTLSASCIVRKNKSSFK